VSNTTAGNGPTPGMSQGTTIGISVGVAVSLAVPYFLFDEHTTLS
jgi:hypothetical protein